MERSNDEPQEILLKDIKKSITDFHFWLIQAVNILEKR